MSEERPANSNDPNRRPPKDEAAQLTFDEVERRLLQRVAEQKDNPVQPLWELAQLYKVNARHDQALACLRDLMQRLPEVEQKAQCIFTMGQSAEQVGDYVAAVRYYKEALSMEPVQTFTWYFILNNLGFSLNTLGHYAEGETYCRKAIEVNRSRPNAYKNLGIALVAQGKYREAAGHFITATYNDSGDARSFGLLKKLLQEHPELEFDFQKLFTRCEQAVEFAAAAIQRAQAGKTLKVLVGTNDSKWQEMCLYVLQAMTGGAVKIDTKNCLHDFVEKACAEDFDLGLFTPMFLVPNQAASPERDPWADAVRAIRRIMGNRRMALILAGVAEDVEKHSQTCREAGAGAVLEMSFETNALVDATRRFLAQS